MSDRAFKFWGYALIALNIVNLMIYLWLIIKEHR